MTSSDDLDQIINDYLRRLNLALSDLTPARREQLIASITDHIIEARSSLSAHNEAAVRDILERIGEPEDIAAEAKDSQANVLSKRAPNTKKRRLIAFCVVVALGIAIGAFLFSRPTGPTGPTSTTYDTSPITTSTLSTTVPNVLGNTVSTAERELISSRLSFAVSTNCSQKKEPSNIVSAQTPTAGTRVPTGTEVRLVVTTSNCQ